MNDDDKQIKNTQNSMTENKQQTFDSRLLDFEKGKAVKTSQIPPKQTGKTNEIKK